MTPLIAIYQVTLRQLMGRSRMIGFALLALVPTGILTIAARAGGIDEGGLDGVVATMLVAPLFAVLIPIVTLVIAGSALGDERADKTLSFLVMRPVSRIGIAAAKTLSAATVASVFGVIGVVGLTGAYAVLGGEAMITPAAIVGAVVACTAYSALFVLFGFMTSRSTLLGLIYVFLIENLLMNLLPRLTNLSPWRIGFSAMVDLFPAGFDDRSLGVALGGLEPSFAGALLKTLLIFVVTCGALGMLLHRRDTV